MNDVLAYKINPQERLPVDCLRKPVKDGPMNPPRFPIELINAIPTAAIPGASRVVFKAQKGPKVA